MLESLVRNLERVPSGLTASVSSVVAGLVVRLESLASQPSYQGSRARVFSLLEQIPSVCPQHSILQLLAYRRKTDLFPARAGWLTMLTNILTKFYVEERRPAVRLAALEVNYGIMFPPCAFTSCPSGGGGGGVAALASVRVLSGEPCPAPQPPALPGEWGAAWGEGGGTCQAQGCPAAGEGGCKVCNSQSCSGYPRISRQGAPWHEQ